MFVQNNSLQQTEQVEIVKSLIRAHNYQQFERVHQICISKGIKVNRPALDNFGRRLALLDKQKNSFQLEPGFGTTTKTDGSSARVLPFPSSQTGNEAHIRRDQIAYELGMLRIKEQELLRELQGLKL